MTQTNTNFIIDSLTIKCFKATDVLENCLEFSKGHSNVLKDFGVKQVTSANTTWHHNPNSYIIPVSTPNIASYIAGARVDVYGATIPLPIEEAVGIIDKSIYPLVKSYSDNGTGEVCGLWTSSRAAGNGIAFMLIKSAIVVANILGLESLFALCSPFTVSMFTKLGFEVEKTLGNEGTFYYPKLDLIATAMILKQVPKMELALPEYKKSMLDLIQDPQKTFVEECPKNNISVNYNLTV